MSCVPLCEQFHDDDRVGRRDRNAVADVGTLQAVLDGPQRVSERDPISAYS
jgi:hypothetical protein